MNAPEQSTALTVQVRAAPPMTQDYLKKHLHYDPETGIFTRLIANSPASSVGDIAGWKTKLGYIELKIDGIVYKAHRLAWLYVHGRMPAGDIDHANMIRTDNRIANIREATRSQNEYNREKSSTNKTGFKGVSFHKAANKFVAQSCLSGKKIYLGVFDRPEDAARAYKDFATAHHGQFART